MTTQAFTVDTTYAGHGQTPEAAVRDVLDRIVRDGFRRCQSDGLPRKVTVEREASDYGRAEKVTWIAEVRVAETREVVL